MQLESEPSVSTTVMQIEVAAIYIFVDSVTSI